MKDQRSQAGFSLVEVLVAVLVFAIASAMGVGILTSALRAKAVQEVAGEQAASMQRVRALLRDDLGQLAMRSYRAADGMPAAHVFAGSIDGADRLARQVDGQPLDILLLTRRGWANPGAVRPRSTLQRVAWRFDGRDLQRAAWAYPDEAATSEPVIITVLENISEVRLEFLFGRGWSQSVFASSDQTGGQGAPRAVRLSYMLQTGERVEHLVLTPNGELGR
ncbi:MAG: type II secretion system minor pseudopilin GspJ [Pseudomonadota bacterium]